MASAPSSVAQLRFHSHFSLQEGVGKLKDIVDTASQRNLNALALTDVNMYGYIKFNRAAKKAGIKPICGAELRVPLNLQSSGNPNEQGSLILLAKEEAGYKNICKLVSRFHLQKNEISSSVLDWLKTYNEGLAVLSGGTHGIVESLVQQDKLAAAEDWLEQLAEWFQDDLHLELHRTGHPNQDAIIEQQLSLAKKFSLPCVATNPIYFINQPDHPIHTARVANAAGIELRHYNANPHRGLQENYIQSAEQLVEKFKDLPQALINANLLAEKCNFEMQKSTTAFMPKVAMDIDRTPEEELEHQVNTGLLEKLNKSSMSEVGQDYLDRLDIELDLIKTQGYATYFLVVADMIAFAHKNSIPVGPGRGSAAGSLVAWSMAITDVDPLAYGLLFERFLHKERAGLPDIDIDICSAGRDQVVKYVFDSYGEEKVAMIAAVGTMGAKASVRDAARILGRPAINGNQLANAIPTAIGVTIKSALADSPDFARMMNNEDDKEVIDLAMKLEGCGRNISKHAAGVVIAPDRLDDWVPLWADPDTGAVVTQYDMNDLDYIGYVKFDLLGLSTLTQIDRTLELIKATKPESEHIGTVHDIPLDDEATFETISKGLNNGIFQLENPKMQGIIRRFKPNTIPDMSVLVALLRPGPLSQGMMDTIIQRKHEPEKNDASETHPLFNKLFQETWGSLIYQEQVMVMAREMAGYSFGKADLLRRSMGKKNVALMEGERSSFIKGAVERGETESDATEVFNSMAKFAEYGFNKSHSVCYGLISYWTAYLKTHHTREFLATTLDMTANDDKRTDSMIREAHEFEIKVLRPCVNESQARFSVKDGSLRYGLQAIKSIGKKSAEDIVHEREQGPYVSMFDLSGRLPSNINKSALKALSDSGALDSFGLSHAVCIENIETAISYAEQKNQSASQVGLFEATADDDGKHIELVLNQAKQSKSQSLPQLRSKAEKNSLGHYLNYHPTVFWDPCLQGKTMRNGKTELSLSIWTVADRLQKSVEDRPRDSDPDDGVTYPLKHQLVFSLAQKIAQRRVVKTFDPEAAETYDYLKATAEGSLVVVAEPKEKNRSWGREEIIPLPKFLQQMTGQVHIKWNQGLQELKPFIEKIEALPNGTDIPSINLIVEVEHQGIKAQLNLNHQLLSQDLETNIQQLSLWLSPNQISIQPKG